MPFVKYLILGAGPSGLAFAHALRRRGEESFLVLEREREAGGLCRSAWVDGAPLDIGGGHFLDLKRAEVVALLSEFLPRTEWNEFERVAKVRVPDGEVDHPLEGNLWQLPLPAQIRYLESIAQAGAVRGEPEPDSFEPWIRWKLGERIAEEYMLPYNRKIWSMPLAEIGTYWMHKLPAVSFRECLQACLQRSAGGSLPAHGRFLYPKRAGYGEVWERMGAALGEKLVLGCPVERIDLGQLRVNDHYQGGCIVNTIPWPVWARAAALPTEIAAAVSQLVHIGVDVDHVAADAHPTAHWLYEPAPAVSWHRMLCRNNFYPGARGGWTETNSARAVAPAGWRHRNEYAYPVNTRTKPAAMDKIAGWARGAGIRPLGRWGKWEHMNSDVAVMEALTAARADGGADPA